MSSIKIIVFLLWLKIMYIRKLPNKIKKEGERGRERIENRKKYDTQTERHKIKEKIL